jgi:hypothetical protein
MIGVFMHLAFTNTSVRAPQQLRFSARFLRSDFRLAGALTAFRRQFALGGWSTTNQRSAFAAQLLRAFTNSKAIGGRDQAVTVNGRIMSLSSCSTMWQ